MSQEPDKDHAESVRKAVRGGYELRRDVGPELVETARVVADGLRDLANALRSDDPFRASLRSHAKALDLHVRRADGLIAKTRYAISGGGLEPGVWSVLAWTPEQAIGDFVRGVENAPPAEQLIAAEWDVRR